MNKMSAIFTAIALLMSIFSSVAHAEPEWAKPYPIAPEDQKMPTETEAALIVRAPPMMPRTAQRSGFCCLKIDVSPDGDPENIRTSFCTEGKFSRPAKKSVKKWKFNPAVKNGNPVSAIDQVFISSFALTNSSGQIIPDRKRLIVLDGKLDFSIDRLCLGDQTT